MRVLVKLIKKIKVIFSNVLWAARSLMWKRDKGTVLVGAWFGERFADTSRYLYQYLYDHKTELNLKKVVWVTRSERILSVMKNMGYEVYLMDSEESIYFHKRAGYHIICNFSNNNSVYKSDILCKYSYRAIRINLWHGVMPMKGVAAATSEYRRNKEKHPVSYAMKEWLLLHCKIYRTLFISEGGWGDCYYLSTTKAGTEVMRQFFVLPMNKFLETANPRSCDLPKLTTEEIEVKKILSSYKKTVLYLPTFREKAKGFDPTQVAISMQRFLESNEILWVQKGHSADSRVGTEGEKDGNILNLPSDFDINNIMEDITVLVTDYSTAAADAMLYWKPVLYYMPDYDEYMSADRGFVVNPLDVMCGPMFKTLEELKEGILDVALGKSYFEPSIKYVETRYKYWGEEKPMSLIWSDILSATSRK